MRGMSAALRLSLIAGLVLGLPACAAPTAQPAAAPEVVVAVGEPGAKADAPAASAEPAQAPEKAEAVARAEELSKLEEQMLKVLGSSGATTSGVLMDAPAGLLDSLAASSAGVGGVGGLQMGSGGAVRAGGGGLAGLSGPTAVGSGAGSGSAAPAGPKARVAVALASTAGGAVANAASVIAWTAAGMRRCYTRELSQNPGAATGSVRFGVKIGATGEVVSVSAGSGHSVAPAVVGCAQARLQSAQFTPPGGGSAALVVDVLFDKEQP
jgi:hypothetical protein